MVDTSITILTTIIDISQKVEEFSDEVKNLHLTCNIILDLIKDIDVIEIVPKYLIEDLNNVLEDAQQILKEASEEQRKKSWLGKIARTLTQALPGNKLEKIKELNSKLVEKSNFISSILNIKQSTKINQLNITDQRTTSNTENHESLHISKRIKSTCQVKEKFLDSVIIPNIHNENDKSFLQVPNRNEELLPTLQQNSDLLLATCQQDNLSTLQLGSLVLISDDETLKQFEIHSKSIKEELNLQESEQLDHDSENVVLFQFKRLNYIFLQKTQQFLSKLHAEIFLIQKNIVVKKPKQRNITNNAGSQNKKNLSQEYQTCLNDEQLENSEKVGGEVEFEEDFVVEYQFFLKDLSSNGTYILENNFSKHYENEIEALKDDNWVKIGKNKSIKLNDGDLLGLYNNKNEKGKNNVILAYKIQIKV